MQDRLDRLERAVEEISRSVGDLRSRLEALEAGAGSGDSIESSPPAAEAPPAESGGAPPARRGSGGFAETRLPQVGRTLLVLGGAFLLRALTNAGTLPATAGVSVGLVYAFVWLAFARRDAGRGRPTNAAFHGLACVLVAYPLLWESAVRFGVLSPGGVAIALAVLTAVGLGVAWNGRLAGVAWWFTLAAAAAAAALMFAADRPILFTAFLVVLGAATLALAYGRGWGGPRWLVAIPVNLAILRVVVIAAPRHREAVPETVSATEAQALIVLFLLVYLGGFAIVTLVRRRPVGAFEIVQSAAVLLVGVGGAVAITRASGSGGGLVGVTSLAAGALAYAAAFAFVRRHLGRGRNFFFYSSLGLVLVITGSRLLGIEGFCTIVCGVLAVAAALLGGRFDRVTLRAHSAAYAVAVALQSGLLEISTDEILGSATLSYRDVPWALPALVAVTLAYAALVATRAYRTAPRLARVPRTVLAIVSLLGLTALLVMLGVRLVPGGTDGNAGALAAVRTSVLALGAVALAFTRKRTELVELGWLAVVVLAAGALKLVAEDLRAGGAASLFVAFAFYGTALILVPKLLRSPRVET